jgi:hypothetical protein
VAHEEEEERGGPEEVWRAKTRAAVQMLLCVVGSENTEFFLCDFFLVIPQGQ